MQNMLQRKTSHAWVQAFWWWYGTLEQLQALANENTGHSITCEFQTNDNFCFVLFLVYVCPKYYTRHTFFFNKAYLFLLKLSCTTGCKLGGHPVFFLANLSVAHLYLDALSFQLHFAMKNWKCHQGKNNPSLLCFTTSLHSQEHWNFSSAKRETSTYEHLRLTFPDVPSGDL